MRAKRRLARLFAMSGQPHRADRLREEAVELRERIDRFWLERDGFYAMALDGRKHASRALGSNQGHLLWSLAVPPERAAVARDALMRPEMFSGWGIRTLASSEPSYNPVGYHTGSVWPHDTALTAFGLRKYGYDEDFTRIFEGLLEAASHFPDYRLPELFAGFSREDYEIPVPYPVACHPQAWAAGSIPYLLRAGLGLIADGLERRLRVVRPSLPHWLNHVEVHGLEVAGATVDLTFERTGEAVTLADVRIEGEVEVTLEISGTRTPEFGL
jgi:glycogen debranching enzyme